LSERFQRRAHASRSCWLRGRRRRTPSLDHVWSFPCGARRPCPITGLDGGRSAVGGGRVRNRSERGKPAQWPRVAGQTLPRAPRPRVPSVRLGARSDGGAPQPSFRFCLWLSHRSTALEESPTTHAESTWPALLSLDRSTTNGRPPRLVRQPRLEAAAGPRRAAAARKLVRRRPAGWVTPARRYEKTPPSPPVPRCICHEAEA
jgi:hypothetical protein